MTFTITIYYAAILAIFVAIMGAITMVHRAKSGISWGFGDNMPLQCAIRAHANIAEYAPIFIITMGLLEATGETEIWLHSLGIAFISGRIISAAYFHIKQAFILRVIAFWATILPTLIGGILLLM